MHYVYCSDLDIFSFEVVQELELVAAQAVPTECLRCHELKLLDDFETENVNACKPCKYHMQLGRDAN